MVNCVNRNIILKILNGAKTATKPNKYIIMKRIKNMNQNDFRNVMFKAKNKAFTPFAKFFNELTGMDVWFKNKIIPRYILWFNGYRDVKLLIEGKTKYEVKTRPEPVLFISNI